MNDNRIKIGIYFAATLMMGVIGVSGALATIGTHFDKNITMITFGIISIPCVVVIPVTLIAGKLMDRFSKKSLTLIGILLILIGGTVPAFLDSFTAIMVFRGVFGVGIGFVQSLCSALVAEYFEGEERSRVQGHMTSAQMIGCAIMVFVGGWLGSVGWNLTFLVYLFAVISLIGVIVFIPYKKPIYQIPNSEKSTKEPIKITKNAWGWIVLMFLFYVIGQVYSNSVSSLVADREIGNAMQSGLSIAFFCIGGMITGLIYWRILAKAGRFTYTLGLLLLVISYLIMIFGNNIFLIYIGSLICGASFSICTPCMIVGTANSVSARSTAMAVSLSACFQNFAMFICPIIINPVAQFVTDKSQDGGLVHSQNALLIAAVMMAIVAIVFMIIVRKRD